MAKESQFGVDIKSVIDEFLNSEYQGKYQARDHEPLLYEITVDNNLKIMEQKQVNSPKRGSSAFETDLCIFEKKGETSIPRVVIEFKTKITTHVVLTYSAKASKHKQIYPYLRYGMIASGERRVPGRLFTHNEGLDFFASVAGLDEGNQLNEFITALVKAEIQASALLDEVAFGSKETRLFQMVPLAKFE